MLHDLSEVSLYKSSPYQDRKRNIRGQGFFNPIKCGDQLKAQSGLNDHLAFGPVHAHVHHDIHSSLSRQTLPLRRRESRRLGRDGGDGRTRRLHWGRSVGNLRGRLADRSDWTLKEGFLVSTWRSWIWWSWWRHTSMCLSCLKLGGAVDGNCRSGLIECSESGQTMQRQRIEFGKNFHLFF